MTVLTFLNTTELQKYLTTSGITAAQVVAIYFDAVSGHHVLVRTP